MHTGKINFFNEEKGFGFIKTGCPDVRRHLEEGLNLFFHINDGIFEGTPPTPQGLRWAEVTFVLSFSPNGKPKAQPWALKTAAHLLGDFPEEEATVGDAS